MTACDETAEVANCCLQAAVAHRLWVNWCPCRASAWTHWQAPGLRSHQLRALTWEPVCHISYQVEHIIPGHVYPQNITEYRFLSNVIVGHRRGPVSEENMSNCYRPALRLEKKQNSSKCWTCWLGLLLSSASPAIGTILKHRLQSKIRF